MKNLFLLTMFSLILVSCDRPDKPNNQQPMKKDHDSTGVNVRHRDSMNKTLFDQSESKTDKMITQKIQQAIMSDDSLSTNAKNIQIITNEGVVTLHGPVASSQEKDVIAEKIKGIQGIVRIDNQLDIANNY